MISSTQSLASNIKNTSTGRLTDTPLGPPRGTFSEDGFPAPRPAPTFSNPRPTNFANPRPFAPIVTPTFINTAINAQPKINDDGLTVSILPKINDGGFSAPPRGINIGNIPIKTIQTLNPQAPAPIPNNIKVASFSTTVTDDLGKPIENANVYLDNVAIGLTDKNGFVQKTGYNPLAVVKVSFVGFEPYEGLASQLPAKVVLKKGLQLDTVVVGNKQKKGFPWLYAILIVGGLYLGYKTLNKSNSVKASI